jgi:predicted nuclease with TOPRIM domain
MAYISRGTRLSDAISDIQTLLDEITEWREKLEGTNFENTQKYSDLEDCESNLQEGIDALENVSFPGMY